MPLPITFGAVSARGLGLFNRITTAGAVDAYFPYVSLLLPGNGTNGAQNNTFLDSSTNNFSITRNGNTTQGTFSPYGDNWSNYFDGSGDYLQLSYNSNFSFGSGDFTIEGWWYLNNLSSAANPITFAAASPASANDIGFYIYIDGSSNEASVCSGGTYYSVTGWSVQLNSWQHFAFVRQSGTLRLYINGVQVGSASANVSINDNATWTLKLGAYRATSPTRFLNGYLSNIRLLKGTCQYLNGTTFTPPTSPLTAISGTSLLTCQSNRFIDNSSNNFTITRNGDVSVQRFSPFNPSASYSTSVIGGSSYFDGSGDYLSIANSSSLQPGSGDFTYEFWVNKPSAANGPITDFRTTAVAVPGVIYIDASNFPYWYDGVASRTSSVAIVNNAWNHVVVSKLSGTLRIFVNGVQGYSAADAISYLPTGPLLIGGQPYTPVYTTGYIAGFNFVKGTGVSSVVVPTAPPTAVANTQLLCNFTNAGVIDNAMMNDLETVGNAQISTAQNKFGGGSMYFNGTGSTWLNVPPTQNLEFGSGDFTIEMWIYPSDTTRRAIYHGSDGADWSIAIDYNAQKFNIWASSNGTSWNLINADAGGNGIGSITIATGTWTHVAYVRSGTTWQTYVNGVRDINLTGISGSIVNRASNAKSIGKWYFTNGVGNPTIWNGYIDDLRITKGYARYTTNFTPPTQAFPTR